MGYLVLTRDLSITSLFTSFPLLKLPDVSTWGEKTKRHTYGKIPKLYISHNIYICLHIMWSFVLGKKSCFCNSVEKAIPIWTSAPPHGNFWFTRDDLIPIYIQCLFILSGYSNVWLMHKQHFGLSSLFLTFTLDFAFRSLELGVKRKGVSVSHMRNTFIQMDPCPRQHHHPHPEILLTVNFVLSAARAQIVCHLCLAVTKLNNGRLLIPVLYI